MKVRFLGMGVDVGDGVDLAEFQEHLLSINGIQSKLGAFHRYFYCEKVKGKVGYVAGLLVTIKDHKRFCELLKEKGKLKVKVNTVDRNSNLMDFNFFIANMTNGQILYQYYHNSCSVIQFGEFLRKEYKRKQELKCKEEQDSVEKLTQKKEREIKRGYKKGLQYQLMVRPDNLKKLLQELDTVRDFEIDFFELKTIDKSFRPIEKHVKKERRTFSFESGTKSAVISKALQGIVDELNITDGKVTGRDPNGIERIIHFADNPDNFGEYEYDDVAIKLNSLDVDQFQKNWCVTELLKQANKYKQLFDVKIKT